VNEQRKYRTPDRGRVPRSCAPFDASPEHLRQHLRKTSRWPWALQRL